MEGSYCGKTGTSTEVTLSLSQTGEIASKSAGYVPADMCLQGSGTKECPSPAAAGHLPFPARPGQARPWETRQRRAAGPDPTPAALLTLITSFLGVMGFLPPGGAAASSSQRAHGSSPGGAGGARPGPSADNNNKTHNIHTALPICRGNRRDEQHAAPAAAGGAAAGKRSLGVTPPPRRVPRAALAAPPARSCAVHTASRSPRRGPRMAGPPPLCPALPAGRQRGCCLSGCCLQGCYYLSGCCLHGCYLLPARPLPAGRAPYPPPRAPHGGRRYLSGRAASPARMDRAAQWQPNKTPPATPPPPPARAHWPRPRPPNLDPLCHWSAARFGPAHIGAGGGRCPGRGRDAQLWCRVGWGARVGLQPPGGLAVTRRCHWLGSARAEGPGARGGEDALHARG